MRSFIAALLSDPSHPEMDAVHWPVALRSSVVGNGGARLVPRHGAVSGGSRTLLKAMPHSIAFARAERTTGENYLLVPPLRRPTARVQCSASRRRPA